MRLSITRSASASTYYAIRSVKRDGKRSSEVVERFGTAAEITEKHECSDAEAWAINRVAELNREEADKTHKVLVPLSTDARIPEGRQNRFNVGYLFLQKIYCQLGLPGICRKASKNHAFGYDLDAILSRLVYGRILFPSSKLSCHEQSRELYEQPGFELHQIYRALSVIAEESDYIQAQLYQNSKKVHKRSAGVLFYDCTNYFFETEYDEGLKRHALSKEHRPSPVVQMGLLMDRSGIPLAFCIDEGNKNEQTTLRPLEEQIIRDFQLSKFVICTDAGLSSDANRKFNNFGERSFVTTQSVKKLEAGLKKWALSPDGWHIAGDPKEYSIADLEDNAQNRDRVFYKQRLVEGYDEARDIEFTQNLIVTFSLKYKNYKAAIREQQIERAKKALASPSKLDQPRQNDYRRLIKKTAVTGGGEIAEKKTYRLDQKAIENEARYDGFYAVCTNLDDDPAEIIKINRGRWEIEESFRIMKSEFRARPVYLKRDDRIKAHFMTCFIALVVYRLLEKKLGEKFTCGNIVRTLRSMDVAKVGGEGYMPSYTRTGLTDALHAFGGFQTDRELMTEKSMKGMCRRSKGL